MALHDAANPPPAPPAPQPEPGIVFELSTITKGGARGSSKLKAEHFAEVLRRSGQALAAAEQEGKEYKPGFAQRTKDILNYSPTVGDFGKVAIGGAIVVGAYEGVAWGVRRWTGMNPPSLFGGKSAKVVPLRKVGGM
jgi:hypothetical protein